MLLLANNAAKAQTPEFTIGTAINVTTATITLPVTANNFKQILAWQGTINWNNSKLTYLNTNAVTNKLSGIQFNATTTSSKGLLSFFWIDNNLLPQTIADSTVLFEITFNVVANAAGNTDVLFSNSPTALQLSDFNGNKIPVVNYNNGNVSFANEVVPPEFIIGSIANVITSNIIVPVTAKNFIQLMAIQGSIVWDNTRLNLVNTTLVSAKLNGINFNNSISGIDGQLSFLWIDANLLPQTIADTTVLFNISFNVIGSTTGITNINFANSPVLLQTSDALGIAISNTIYSNGIISFPGATLPPTFIIPTVSNVQTSSFNVPITTKNFTQLKAIQGSISWDNRKYNYVTSSSSLSQLNGILFNAAVTGNTGILSYVWADANSSTQTITDNSILFNINFNRICDAVGVNDINFSDLPTNKLVVNISDTIISNVVYVNGRLSIPSSVTPAVYISTPSNILCTSASPILSTILSNGGSAPAYNWYKNNVLIGGANSSNYSSNTFINNDSIKCIITSNVACAATSTATSNIITLVSKAATKDTIILSGCNNVLYNNINYVANTSKQDTLKTFYGCDSIYRLAQIVIVPLTPITQNINLTSCDSILYKSQVYKSSINFIDTVRSSGNCDSIYNNVTISINFSIKGNIKHPTKGSINNVITKLNGSNSSTIISSGNYNFNCLPTSANGSIKPTKNNDIKKNNGVSSIDVILTQNHILNRIKLNSPYKIIAADVNNNRTISNIDIIFMKRLILGIDTTFTGNRLWAFVDSSYQFLDTTNPFPYRDSISFTNLTSNKTNQTFIGVKLGDVNYDWNANLARGTKVDNVELLISDAQNTNLEGLVKVLFKVKNFKDLTALQYTLHFDNSKYEFVNLEGFINLQGLEYNAQQANKTGNISMLWANAKGEETSLEDGTLLFELVLKLKELVNTNLEFGLSLTNDITEIEAWDKNYQQHNVILTKRETKNEKQETVNEKWSVSPNPTKGDVVVTMVSNIVKNVLFELSTADGKMVFKQNVEVIKGANKIPLALNKNKYLPSGLYFLKANGTTQRLVINQ